jgi:acetyl-CoA carboxylase, biotin carboxylase subunit
MFYDSLLAKLVTWGPDRDAARRRMLRALGEIVLDGPHHNVSFHKWLCAHPEFVAGNLSTRFLEEHFRPELLRTGDETGEVAMIAAALHAHDERQRVAVVRREGNRSGDSSAWKWRGRDRGVR